MAGWRDPADGAPRLDRATCEYALPDPNGDQTVGQALHENTLNEHTSAKYDGSEHSHIPPYADRPSLAHSERNTRKFYAIRT